jgi:hypothetical protein
MPLIEDYFFDRWRTANEEVEHVISTQSGYDQFFGISFLAVSYALGTENLIGKVKRHPVGTKVPKPFDLVLEARESVEVSGQELVKMLDEGREIAFLRVEELGKLPRLDQVAYNFYMFALAYNAFDSWAAMVFDGWIPQEAFAGTVGVKSQNLSLSPEDVLLQFLHRSRQFVKRMDQ